jgi:hypothetical protein
MHPEMWFTRSVSGPALGAALTLGAKAQTTAPIPQQQDVHQGKKDIRRDQRDLHQDRM